MAPIRAANAARRDQAEGIAADERRYTVTLLGGFALGGTEGPIALPVSAQRVVSLLALQRRPVQRAFVYGLLWGDVSEEHASACLRTALWRIAQRAKALLRTGHGALSIGDAHVDVRAVEACAQRWLAGDDRLRDAELRGLCDAGELLPDCYEDWAMLARERFRQLRLQALEASVDVLSAHGRSGEALLAAMAAVSTDPLRESAHRAVIRVHLAQGNRSEALRQFRLFRRLARRELSSEPSVQMLRLLGPAAVG
jgi:DNA-binding SARP family transcriptional activator